MAVPGHPSRTTSKELTMEASLFAIAAIVAIVAILGALATLYGEETRQGFAPYGNGG
jgi:hypothetical protein